MHLTPSFSLWPLHHQPTLVSVLRDYTICYAVAAVSHSIFVDSKGRVYTCGKGNGLLGHGDTKIRTVPHRVASLEGVKIVSAAAGVSQSIFISDEGVGYWCGEGMGELKNVSLLEGESLGWHHTP